MVIDVYLSEFGLCLEIFDSISQGECCLVGKNTAFGSPKDNYGNFFLTHFRVERLAGKVDHVHI